VCGAEALLRWQHPERGFVSPARFVPVMEAIGLASEIGAWVLNAAVREASEWRARGFSELRMAVNVSGVQLERDDLPILVERTLQRHALTAGCLEIELTESVATSNADHCRRIFQQLRDMGVKLAVDDFGTGYSGFSSLRTLRFDKIKIDREFVSNVDTRSDSQAICQSIIALARGLGIRVLAEGVERQAEYAWLRRHGCHHFQGYYFSRPLDADRFAVFVRDTRALDRLLSLGGERQTIVERLSA
jgi:EAL domain-containing protein (putative c-di-GMP-specific phosphodiesterase class I)